MQPTGTLCWTWPGTSRKMSPAPPRPAPPRRTAPLTTYLAGVAVGTGQNASDVGARITRLAEGWTPQE